MLLSRNGTEEKKTKITKELSGAAFTQFHKLSFVIFSNEFSDTNNGFTK